MKKVVCYSCKHCGNVIVKVHDGGPIPVCCGDEMTEVVPNSTDAAQEKHVPVIKKNGVDVVVQVGSVMHPMEDEHYIEWITVVSGSYVQTAVLKPGDEPAAEFMLVKDEPVMAFAFCNKHGLWMAKA